HLVHHTSGLRDYLGLGFMSGHPMDDLITEPEALELLSRQKELNFTPGDEYLYSNSGYILMSMIVARASGKSLRQYADEMIFQPLGMKHTHVHDNHLEMVPQRATGYAPAAQGYHISIPNFDMVGDGGIYSCVLDLYKWDQNFYHNRLGKGRSELIERVLSTRKLNDGSDNNYAFGLMVEQYKGLTEVNHGGGYGGYRTEMIRFPEQRFSVIVLGNHAGFRSGDLAHQVADLFLADRYTTTPAAEDTVTVPAAQTAPDLQAYTGLFYSEKTGLSLDIRLADGRLAAQVSDEFTAPLKPAGPHAFEADDGPLPIHLQFTDDGLELMFGQGNPMSFK
ncbi:MAG: serine hydrolase domain-containing protein, partial [Anaerolineaceae bacterium]